MCAKERPHGSVRGAPGNRRPYRNPDDFSPDQASSRRPCPQCGSMRVYRSRRRGRAERAVGLVGLTIRRCRACNARFTRFGGFTILIPDAERAVRKLTLLALMLAGLAAVVAALAWFSTRQPVFSPSEGAALVLPFLAVHS